MGCIVNKAKVKLQGGAFSAFSPSPTQFYKCVQCGYVGDFGKVRVRSLHCGKCSYDLLVDYSFVEYKQALKQRRQDGSV